MNFQKSAKNQAAINALWFCLWTRGRIKYKKVFNDIFSDVILVTLTLSAMGLYE